MAQILQLQRDERATMIEHFMNKGAVACLEIQRLQANMPSGDISPVVVEMWCKEMACLGVRAECYAEIINMLKGVTHA